jgi:hypothetical protein
LILQEASNDNTGPAVIGQKAQNTLAVPMSADKDDVLYQVRLQPYVNSQYRDIGEAINITAEDNASGNYLPTKIQLCTASNAANSTPRITVASNGNVGISSSTPTDTLTVEGGITSSYGFYHDRGDAATYDFVLDTHLLHDDTWRDLDLSMIVEPGAKAVLLFVVVRANDTNSVLMLRKNGYVGLNKSQIQSEAVGIPNCADITVGCDVNRVIEYYATNTIWTIISIVVKGWWK